MSVSYANELYELRRWVDNVNQGFASNQPMIAAPNTPPSVKRLIGIVSNGIKDEYPHYASTLARVADILFIQTGYGTFSINPIAFGEMFVMIRHIQAEPVNMQSWSMIHSRISKVAFDLYRDGHFGTAAEKSVKELETRLRELCTEVPCSISGSAILSLRCLKKVVYSNSVTIPPPAGRIIGAEYRPFSREYSPPIAILLLTPISLVRKERL